MTWIKYIQEYKISDDSKIDGIFFNNIYKPNNINEIKFGVEIKTENSQLNKLIKTLGQTSEYIKKGNLECIFILIFIFDKNKLNQIKNIILNGKNDNNEIIWIWNEKYKFYECKNYKTNIVLLECIKNTPASLKYKLWNLIIRKIKI